MNSFGILERCPIPRTKNSRYLFTAPYGPVVISISTIDPENVKWNEKKIICTDGIVTLTCPLSTREPETFEIHEELEQVFQLNTGKAFFTISYKGNSITSLTEPFLFLRNGEFIPELDRLKERVLVR